MSNVNSLKHEAGMVAAKKNFLSGPTTKKAGPIRKNDFFKAL